MSVYIHVCVYIYIYIYIYIMYVRQGRGGSEPAAEAFLQAAAGAGLMM